MENEPGKETNSGVKYVKRDTLISSKNKYKLNIPKCH